MATLSTDQIIQHLREQALTDPETGWLSDLASQGLEFDEYSASIEVGPHGSIDLGHLAEIIERIAQGGPLPEA